jgi:glycosyltransferase involved in cell wall biosynthesis
MAKTSIVIASKVGAPFIDQCLDSVRSQAQALDAEVIVVAAGAAGYAARLAADYPWARIVHAPETRKVPALRRRGGDRRIHRGHRGTLLGRRALAGQGA